MPTYLGFHDTLHWVTPENPGGRKNVLRCAKQGAHVYPSLSEELH